jgi:pilus assembly protein CpaF
MRPDRIIVGEVRGNEILDMVQSISSGHSGCLSIVHADSPEECFNRMTTMMLMSGINLDGDEIQRQLGQSIDLIVYSELFIDGVRRIVNITDVAYDKSNRTTRLEDIFTFRQDRIDDNGKVFGDWVQNKRPPSSLKKFEKRNIKLPAGFFN